MRTWDTVQEFGECQRLNKKHNKGNLGILNSIYKKRASYSQVVLNTDFTV